MNILLWILQAVLALYCVAGSVWRMLNYEQAGQQIASVKALPYAIWGAIGVFEILCAFGLVLPGLFRVKPMLTPIAAGLLVVEMLLVSALHLHFFGWRLNATNPAVWTLGLALLAALIAYGRLAIRPL